MFVYSKIDARFWDDEKVLALSLDARYLMLYLLTTKHRNVLGCFQMPKAYAMEDTKMPEKRFSYAWNELLASGIISYDEKVRMLFVKNFLRYNPIENPNQVKGALTKLESAPKSRLFLDAFKYLKGQAAAGEKSYLEPLIEALPILFSEPSEEPLSEPLQQQLSKPDNSNQVPVNSNSKKDTTPLTSSPTKVLDEIPKPKRRKPCSLTKMQEEQFNRFWAVYPHKVAIGEAEKAWAKIDPDDILANKIIEAVPKAIKLDSRFREERWTPHPATWLNGREWLNEYDNTQKGGSDNGNATDRRDDSGFRGSTGFRSATGEDEP